MPDENSAGTPEMPVTPVATSQDSMRTRIERFILDPYSMLVMMVYVLAIGGLAVAITEVFGYGDGDANRIIRGLLSYIWLTAGAVGFALGMLAIVHGIRARKAGGVAERPAGLFFDPVTLFTFAPFVFAIFGLIKVVYDLADSSGGQVEGILWWMARTLFYVSAGTFLMLALKAISDWLHAKPSTTAPPAAATATPEGEGSETALTPATTSSFSSITDSINTLTADANKVLLFGTYLTAYIGLLAVIFDTWWWWDDEPGDIWHQFFHDMALVGGVVAFLLIARPLVNWITGREVTGGDIQRAEGESNSAWAQRLANNPMHAINIGAALAIAIAMPLFLMDLWTARNFPVDSFWSRMTENILMAITVIGALMVLRAAAMIVLSGPSMSMGQRLRQASGLSLIDDPAQILRVLVYAIAFFGLINVSLTVWDVQGQKVWAVWYVFFNSFGLMALPLAMALGAKAMVREIGD